jgi:hypothetical protein
MSLLAFETPSSHAQTFQGAHSRRQHRQEDQLILTELNSQTVVDHLDDPNAPTMLTTFGTVRETCPRCMHTHLSLVLRQRNVRIAHLFCTECHSCFDANYPNGRSALTI